MDGTRDEELYRDLLLAQCRALNRAMPFLFEPVNDETELLLPDRKTWTGGEDVDRHVFSLSLLPMGPLWAPFFRVRITLSPG